MERDLNNYILLTSKPWHDVLFNSLSDLNIGHWSRISNKSDFNIENLDKLNPKYIFIPHWSYLIPEYIYKKYKCIVFHMTDLPYGRGGSPLQNLILQGHKSTMISAIDVVGEIDAGDVYLKKQLNLDGSAYQIFTRSSNIIKEMILEIISSCPSPIMQHGEPFYFIRRKPDESNIFNLDSLVKIYDYIRMLDCEGYPKAFIENELFKFEFENAKIENNNIIFANVRIFKK